MNRARPRACAEPVVRRRCAASMRTLQFNIAPAGLWLNINISYTVRRAKDRMSILTPTLSRFEAREGEFTVPLPPLPRFAAGEGGAHCVSHGRVRVDLLLAGPRIRRPLQS